MPSPLRASSRARHNALLPLMLLFATRLASAEIELAWNDNSDDEDGFHVERSRAGSPFVLIATLPPNTTRYTEATIGKGVKYRYRVNAFNAFGKSGYTNAVTVQLPRMETYREWIIRMFNSGFRSGNRRAPDASVLDLPNLLCYAHGINPFQPDRSLLPRIERSLENGRPVARLHRTVNRRATGLKTILLVSSDLITWTPHPIQAHTLRETLSHRWESISLPQLGARTFYRLEVALDSASASRPTGSLKPRNPPHSSRGSRATRKHAPQGNASPLY